MPVAMANQVSLIRIGVCHDYQDKCAEAACIDEELIEEFEVPQADHPTSPGAEMVHAGRATAYVGAVMAPIRLVNIACQAIVWQPRWITDES